MDWWKDYSKVIALATLVAGVVLLYTGETAIGATLVAAATGVGVGKFTNKKASGFLLVACLLACSACIAPSTPNAIIELQGTVYDRHDAYVLADETLQELDRRVYLRSTEVLRGYQTATAEKQLQNTPTGEK